MRHGEVSGTRRRHGLGHQMRHGASAASTAFVVVFISIVVLFLILPMLVLAMAFNRIFFGDCILLLGPSVGNMYRFSGGMVGNLSFSCCHLIAQT